MSMNNPDFHPNRHNCHHSCSNLCCTKIISLDVNIGSNIILKNINLHIHCGEFTAIIGPNGAGKSTLLKAILGEIKHNGKLEFVKAAGSNKRKPIIGYVPQTPRFEPGYPVSVLDLFVASTTNYPVWFPIKKKIRKRVLGLLERVSASNLIDKRIGVLSGGELQRVMLALALEPVPELLLLDEPSSGIDIKGIESFYAVVDETRRKYDLSVVMISHDMHLVKRYADRVILLNQTIVKEGTPNEVLNSPEYNTLFRNTCDITDDSSDYITDDIAKDITNDMTKDTIDDMTDNKRGETF